MPPFVSFARVLGLCGFLGSAFAADAVFRSGPAQVPLVELYTSEGCSSCPPAEKWLRALRDDPGLWTRFVPVAFHVNYWDHLGWKDALATKAFTEREYAYSSAWSAASVYTPCFVRNGEEWRPSGAPTEPRGVTEAGQLTVTWSADNRTARIDYTAPKSAKPSAKFDVNVALLGGGIVSNVRKGENAGRELRHEFVALRQETLALKRDAGGVWSAQIVLAARADITVARHAIAAWVTHHGQLATVQATGGWIE